MKTMSQVAKLSDCCESLDEARGVIDRQERDLRRLRDRCNRLKRQRDWLRLNHVSPTAHHPYDLYAKWKSRGAEMANMMNLSASPLDKSADQVQP